MYVNEFPYVDDHRTLFIAATAFGVALGVDSHDVQMDIAAIETPPIDRANISTGDVHRVWWNLLGKALDWLN